MTLRRKNSWLILLIVAITSLGSSAQHEYRRFENISIKDGLSHSYVKCMWQDHLGFLWFGTLNGLNRYDGYSFKVFQNRILDPSSLSANQINDITENKDGDLWIATEGGGFNLYNREKNRFEEFRHNPDDLNSVSRDFVNCLMEDDSGMIWIGTDGEGLDVFDTQKGAFKHYHSSTDSGLKDDYILAIFEDHDRQIWIGTQRGGLFRYDKSTDSFISYALSKDGLSVGEAVDVRVIFEDSQQRLWIGTGGQGIFVFDSAKGGFTSVSPGPAMTANAMKSDREECLTAGMDNYISKPIMIEELTEKLDKWVSQVKV